MTKETININGSIKYKGKLYNIPQPFNQCYFGSEPTKLIKSLYPCLQTQDDKLFLVRLISLISSFLILVIIIIAILTLSRFDLSRNDNHFVANHNKSYI